MSENLLLLLGVTVGAAFGFLVGCLYTVRLLKNKYK